jgi:hypothetical protein
MKTTNTNAAAYTKAMAIWNKYTTQAGVIANAQKAGADVLAIIEKKLEREITNHARATTREFAQGLIKERLTEIAKSIPEMGYSMGDYLAAECCKIRGAVDTTREYPRSAKFRATHGHFVLQLTAAQLRKTHVTGGIITIGGSPNSRKAERCQWFEFSGKKQYFRAELVSGWIYAGAHGTSRADAIETGKRRIDQEKNQAKKAAIDAAAAKKWKKEFNAAARMQYTFADARAAGMCEAGIRVFAQHHKIDTAKKYRGSFLLKLELHTSEHSHIERMIMKKIRK